MARPKKINLENNEAPEAARPEEMENILTLKELENSTKPITLDEIPKTARELSEGLIKVAQAVHDITRQYQVLAVGTIVHFHTHRDINVIRNLLLAMPSGTRKATMAAFIDKFASVMIDDKGEFHYDKSRYAKMSALPVANLIAAKWNEVKQETKYRPYDFKAAFESFIKQAESKLTKSDVTKGDNVTIQEINLARKFFNEKIVPLVDNSEAIKKLNEATAPIATPIAA